MFRVLGSRVQGLGAKSLSFVSILHCKTALQPFIIYDKELNVNSHIQHAEEKDILLVLRTPLVIFSGLRNGSSAFVGSIYCPQAQTAK